MPEQVAFAYAGARMQARQGQAPGAESWRAWAGLADFARLLQTLRATPLAPWVADLEPDADAHRIEAVLRARFRTEVDELADWVPRLWRGAVLWFSHVPDLPLIAHVRQGHSLPAWQATSVEGRLTDRVPASLLRHDGAAGERTPGLWQRGWAARWPLDPARAEAPLAEVHRSILRLVPRPNESAAVGEGDRHALASAFRRHTRAPAGLLAYMGLLYARFLDLRGLLLRARLFTRGR